MQAAHERELAACHETVKILQQRLNEREEGMAIQKRRRMPIDYYSLKAKVIKNKFFFKFISINFTYSKTIHFNDH